MWNIADSNQHDAKQGLSKDLGLALLSKVLGVRSIEGQFQSYIDRLKKSKLVTDLNKRLNIQQHIQNEILKMSLRQNAQISKMYWKSKKKVYGIDNELHMVE